MNFKKMYEEESLAGKTVVAFTSALLVLQSWLWSRGELELCGTCTVNIPIAVFITISAILFGISVFLAVATVVPPRSPYGLSHLRSSAIRTAHFLSRGLDFMVLIGYTVSWLSAWTSIKLGPASGQWLSDIVLWAGFGFFIFIGIWLIRRELSRTLRVMLHELRLIYRRFGPGRGCNCASCTEDCRAEGWERTGCGGKDEVRP